jgi:chromosome segregation ATPase
MDTIALTIFRKYTAHPEVNKRTRLLVRLALTEFDEVYQDEILAWQDERQRLQSLLAEALDCVRQAEERMTDAAANIAELTTALIAAHRQTEELHRQEQQCHQ